MANLTEDELAEMIDMARADERERCALLAEALATIFERRAAQLRTEGSYTTRALWPLGKPVTCVRPSWEKAAKVREDAADALRNAIATGCRAGWDPRKQPEGMAARTGVDGDPTLVDLGRRAK